MYAYAHMQLSLLNGTLGSQDFAKQYYGKLPLNQSQERENRQREQIALLPSKVGQKVLLRARIQTSRATGKMVFLVLRQRIDTIQAILSLQEGKVSKPMVKWVSGLPDESIVLVEAIVEKSQEEVKSATVKDVELQVEQVGVTLYILLNSR